MIKGSHFSFFQTTAPGRRSRWTVPLPALPKLPRMSSRSQERSRNTPEPEPGSGAKRTRDLRNKISFWKRRSASITDYDPQYRVTYLGNVLTGWAKGEKAFFMSILQSTRSCFKIFYCCVTMCRRGRESLLIQ